MFIFIVQLPIPVVLLRQSIKQTIFVSILKNILGRYRSLFSKPRNKKNDSEVIRNILEYEATIAWRNIILNEKTYNKLNASLSKEWNDIKQEYDIKDKTIKVLLP